MFRKEIRTYFLFAAFIFFTVITGCGNKDEQTTGKKTQKENVSSGNNADLLKKDSTGTKVQLVVKPAKGDIFKYKMIAKTLSKEKSPMTGDQEVNSTQDVIYYYTEEVNDISSGILTYKVKFDSINIVSSLSARDSTQSMSYNSNVKDSNYSKPDFIQYNSIIGENFFVRVSSAGEISEVYGLEKVFENMFKALGDTLSMEQKESFKESFGKEAIKAVLQQQFQMFPANEVYKDSSWTRSYETQILIFPVKNILNYKLKDIKEDNGQNILTIDADLSVDFINKELKEKKMTYTVESAKTGGRGTIVFNLTRGCVVSKDTRTNIDLDLRLSAGGQSVKTSQNVTTELKVELLP